MNAFIDINVEDEEENYPDPVSDPRATERKDLLWLMDGCPEDTKIKLAYRALASKYSGHGTTMSELKSKTLQIPSTTPCNSNFANTLCDCFLQAATDMGKGRGNPRKYASATRASA